MFPINVQGEYEEIIKLLTHVTPSMIIALIIFPLLIRFFLLKERITEFKFTNDKSNYLFYAISIILAIIITVIFIKSEDMNLTLLLCIYLLIQTLGEEILFRSTLQQRLNKIMRPSISILITTSLFVWIFHSDVGFIENLLYRFPFSFLLGYVFNYTKNIYSSWMMHFINNLIVSM